MSSIGYIQVHSYTSDAQIPVRDVAVVVTAPDHTALAMRLTDRSGLISAIEIPVPDRKESQEPGAVSPPYAIVNLYAYKNGYEQIVAEHIQVFAGTTTFQDLELIPLSEFPFDGDESMLFDTPPQDL